MYLTDGQTSYLNEIYTRIMKKYSAMATDTVRLSEIPVMTREQAAEIARLEAEEKEAKILENYDEQVRLINVNAAARGMSLSSVVISQLAKAAVRRDNALSRLENQIEKRTEKIFAEGQKLALSVEKEKAASKSRSIRDFTAIAKLKQNVPYNAQTLIDEELYCAYLEWLLQFSPQVGLSYVQDNIVFYYNMSMMGYSRLLDEMIRRAEGL